MVLVSYARLQLRHKGHALFQLQGESQAQARDVFISPSFLPFLLNLEITVQSTDKQEISQCLLPGHPHTVGRGVGASPRVATREPTPLCERRQTPPRAS